MGLHHDCRTAPYWKASSTKRFEERFTPGAVLFIAQNWYSTIDRDLFGEMYPGFASGVRRTLGNRSRRLQIGSREASMQ